MSVLLDFVHYFTELAARPPGSPDRRPGVGHRQRGSRRASRCRTWTRSATTSSSRRPATTRRRASIAGGLLALLEHRDQLELLQAEPELIDAAADELIRYVSPVKHFMRNCQAPFTLRDTTFEPGDLLYLSFASANRDESVFADPFRLDVRRENASSHLAFGFGRHFCLGAHLARMEIRALFKELLGRLERIELDGEPTWTRAYFVEGPKSIPIRYRLR